jgi:hypothetical protein
MDHDVLTADDSLGEVRVGLNALAAHQNEPREYALTGAGATGSVTLMVGDAVEQAVLKAVDQWGKEQAVDLQSETVNTGWLSAMGQYFSESLESVKYFATMISFLIAGNTQGFEWGKVRENALRTHATVTLAVLAALDLTRVAIGRGRLSPLLQQWFTDRCGADWVWQGPYENNCTTYQTHADVTERLSSWGERFGTNNLDGSIYRQNFLGFQLLVDAIWPEKPVTRYANRHTEPLLGPRLWYSIDVTHRLFGVLQEGQQGIGLSADQESHAFVRPLLDRMVGPNGNWSREQVREFAQKFWRDPEKHHKDRCATAPTRIHSGSPESSGAPSSRSRHSVAL